MNSFNFPKAVIGALLAVTVTGCAGTGSTGTGASDASPEVPARFTYAPFDVTYRLASHTHQEQEFGGQINASDFALHWYLTALYSPPSITLTVDSVPELSGAAQGVSQTELEQAGGVVFTGSLSPTGQVSDFSGTEDSGAFVQQLAQSIERFLPRLPEGGVAPGQTWTDTLESTTGSGGLDIDVVLITRSEAASWAQHRGARALLVTTNTDYSLSGGGSQMGTEIDLSGTGIRHGTLYLSEDGRFLGGVSADTANMTATVAAMGAIIPVFQTRYDTVTVAR
ncbi:MAG: hypothetical protein PVH40_00710 [Gemmatimonadales bacterium]|jgi:hypothetical protein